MIEDPLHDPDRLAALRETQLLDAPSKKSLDRYVRIARAALGVPAALVSLVDDHRQFFASLTGLPEPWATCRETPLSHSFCQHVVRGAQALVVEDAREHPLVRDNLAVRDLAVIAYLGVPIRSSGGHMLGSFCVIDSQPRPWSERDIAVITDLADAVNDEIDSLCRAGRAERSEQRLSALSRRLQQEQVAGAARSRSAIHDLRSPLTVVALGVESVLSHDSVSTLPELVGLLEIVRRNVEHSAALLTSIHAAGDTGEGAGRSTVDLAALTRETCADLATGRPSPSLDVSAVAAEPVLIAGDATNVRRCVENLVSNALRFAATSVFVSVTRSSDEATLAVEDDGAGLPTPDAYRTAWEPTTRFHLGEGKSGSGLGLSIVRQIVEQSGGWVSAEPSTRGGASFALHFPIGE